MITGLSSDGKTAVGTFGDGVYGYRLFLWQQQKGIKIIAKTEFDTPSPIISGNGTKVFYQSDRLRSSRWSSECGSEKIEYTNRGTFPGSRINCTSFTGESWVGMCLVDPKYQGNDNEFVRTDTACLWRSLSQPFELGRPGSILATEATGCNDDGSLIIGNAFKGDRRKDEPFRWSRAKGYIFLDSPLLANVKATHMSNDGKFIFGTYDLSSGDEAVVVWIGESFAGTLLEIAHKRGLPKESGWHFNHVVGTSKDGHSIVGINYSEKGRLQSWLVDW